MEITKEWIERLKYYTDRLKNEKDAQLREFAIEALLGYLESLEMLDRKEK